MSDDEDLEPMHVGQGGGAGAGITASQLAAALAAAGAPTPSSSQQPPAVSCHCGRFFILYYSIFCTILLKYL